MTLAQPKVQAVPATDDNNLLTVTTTPNSAPVTGTVPSSARPGYHTDLTQKLAKMDMQSEKKLDLRNEDLKELQELGQGNGGSVKKVEHVPSGKIMAKKVRVFHATYLYHPSSVLLGTFRKECLICFLFKCATHHLLNGGAAPDLI